MEWVNEQLNTELVAQVIAGLKPSRPVSAHTSPTSTVCTKTSTGNADCWSGTVS